MSDDQSQGKRKKKSGLTKLEPIQRGERGPRRPPPPEPPAEPREKAPAAPPAPALPTLRTLEPGTTPQYRGLRRDATGAVVGSVALVLVQGRARRAAFLAALSRVHDLSAGITVEAPLAGTAGGGSGHLPIILTPPEGDAPIRFYELIRGALAAARLGPTRSGVYTGDGRVFVPYGDPTAPHGYDVQGDLPAEGRVLLTSAESRALPPARPMPLLEALLEVPLQRDRRPEPPVTLAVLTDRRLAPLVAGYVQRHGLAYAVRFLTWERAGQAHPAALFDIVTADAIRPIPPFVCDFLRRLPRTLLLTDALERADLEHEPPQRVLVPQGRQTPLFLPNIQHVLPTSSLLVLAKSPWSAVVIPAPPPRQTMQTLTRIEFSASGRADLGPPAADQLRLQLTLEHDGSTNRPIHGLLLDERALARLRRMVRHLPRPLFEQVQIALGDDVAVLVATGERGSIEGLPLGQPLTRAEPPELLLPRGMHLRPTLPLDLLVPALALPPDSLTVLTRTQRYDLPRTALQPLGNLLYLDRPAQTLAITVSPVDLPPLDLSDLLEVPPPAPVEAREPAAAPEPTPESGGLFDRIRQAVQGPPAGSAPFEAELRRRAEQLQQAGDYLSAAIFYHHLRDAAGTNACLEQLIKRRPT
jgi:hypothetical protein